MRLDVRQRFLASVNFTALASVVALALLFFFLLSSPPVPQTAADQDRSRVAGTDGRLPANPPAGRPTTAAPPIRDRPLLKAADSAEVKVLSSLAAAHGRQVTYALEWIGGGKRRKISGEVPRYPQGVTAEVRIRVDAVVQPNGTVKSVRQAQKTNAALEESAMREVRKWRFDPLPRGVPQRNQRCIVAFTFRMK